MLQAEGITAALPKLINLFWHLAILSWPLAGLTGLSIVEALLVSQVGRVTGVV